jgi:acetolactate synthase-1/2/3 large subunit
MPDAYKIKSDAKEFIKTMLSYPVAVQPDRGNWFEYCNKLKKRYPGVSEYVPKYEKDVNPYLVAHYIGEHMGDNDVLVTSPSAFAYAFGIPRIHRNQRLISHIGLGSMGTALPEAMGACVASGARTIVCEGDGSLQHNIQELAVIKHYNLPIKLIVDSNQGYRQISTMQDRHFEGRHAGCTEKSGITFPDLELLAKAYGIKYYKIDSASVMENVIEDALVDENPAIVEMITTMDIEYLPVIKSKLNLDGTMQTPSLEVLYPFLSEDEHLENMEVPCE